ncbi:hypothetical protein CPB86DRAFT_289726 [Serendipita vermifera]|nr:hypothetical protein CPB86DRAFT_289726 [Serendipita vermifera]
MHIWSQHIYDCLAATGGVSLFVFEHAPFYSLMSSYLDVTIHAIKPGYGSYARPETTACSCNSVIYQLYSAWSYWRTNCTDDGLITVATYPKPIPFGTAVPAWAYLDITMDDSFNPTDAKAMMYTPESTPPPTSSIRASNTVHSDGDHVPIIVGGVVGCILGLGILSLLALFIQKRYNSQTSREVTPYTIVSQMPPDAPLYTPWSPPPPQFSTVDPTQVRRDTPSGGGATSNPPPAP